MRINTHEVFTENQKGSYETPPATPVGTGFDSRDGTSDCKSVFPCVKARKPKETDRRSL